MEQRHAHSALEQHMQTAPLQQLPRFPPDKWLIKPAPNRKRYETVKVADFKHSLPSKHRCVQTSASPSVANSKLISASFNVKGLHCADCASNLERALFETGAVTIATANMFSSRLELSYYAEQLNTIKILHICDGLGFKGELRLADDGISITFSIPLPPSHSYLPTDEIVSHLKSQPGILSAAFEPTPSLSKPPSKLHSEHSLTVSYAPDITGARRISSALSSLPAPLPSLHPIPFDRDLVVSNEEEKKLRSSVIHASWLASLVVLVAYVSPFVPFMRPLHHTQIIRGVTYATALMCVLATIIQVFVGAPIFTSGVKAIRFNGRANMDTLVAFSSSTAFAYSVIALIANIAANFNADDKEQSIASSSAGVDLSGSWGEPVFESPAILIAIVVVGRWIEQSAKKRASSAIVSLSKSQPDEALLLKLPVSLPGDVNQLPLPNDATLTAAAVDTLPLMMLQRGDVVRVHAGAVFPADGTIIAGSTSANEAMLTGESRAISKPCGSEVIGGTSNLDAIVHVRVNKVAAESTLSSIVRLVQEAQSSKPPSQRAADAVSARFIPFIIMVTLASFIVWLSLALAGQVKSSIHPVLYALQFSLSVLVVSCPCAIGLAVPTAIMVACTVASRSGVLVRSGAALEKCRGVNAVCFDKTGTLTSGDLTVERIVLDGDDNAALMKLSPAAAAASSSRHPRLVDLLFTAASQSDHPISRAIAASVGGSARGGSGSAILLPSENSQSLAGKGVESVVGGQLLRLGSAGWVLGERTGRVPEKLRCAIEEFQGRAWSVVVMEWGGTVVGAVGLTDSLREDARSAVAALKQQGIAVYCLSGDNAAAAEATASAAGINKDFIRSSLTPEAKAAFISGLQSAGQRVVMVGDGVNDSPALAIADVGVAIGGGSDIARSTADVVLVRNDLMSLPMLLQLSATTFEVIRLNFFWGFLYNITAIPFATGALYTCCGLYIPLAFAGISELFSSVPVVMFSLLLFKFKYTAPHPTQLPELPSVLSGCLAKFGARLTRSSYRNFDDEL